MSGIAGHSRHHWLTHLEGIDLEIAREAIICGVPLLEQGVIGRVLAHDAAVCSHRNTAAFTKLRALLIMHYTVQDRAMHALGETATLVIGEQIREHLRGRIGTQLGALPA